MIICSLNYLSVKQDKEMRKGCVLYLAPLVPAVGIPVLPAPPCFLSAGRTAQWLGTRPEVRQT